MNLDTKHFMVEQIRNTRMLLESGAMGLALGWLFAFPARRGAARFAWRIAPWVPLILGSAMLFDIVENYVHSRQVLDHIETYVLSYSWAVIRGAPLYHSLDAGERYALLYGPGFYLIVGAALWVSGASIGVAKAVVAAMLAVSLWAVPSSARRWLGSTWAAWVAAWFVFSVLAFVHAPFWVRSDSIILACAALAIWFSSRRSALPAAIAVGACGGLLFTFKIQAPFYVLPAAGLLVDLHGRRSLLPAVLTGGAIGLAPFLLPQISARDYMTWLRMAAGHGIDRDLLLNFNLPITLLFLAPCLAALAWRLLAGRRDLLRDLSRNRFFWLSLLVSLFVVLLTSTKPGAGPHHLMGLLPSFAAATGIALGARPGAGRRGGFAKPPHWLAVSAMLAAALAAGRVGYDTGSAVHREIARIRAEADPPCLSQLVEASRLASRSGTFELGYGSTNDYWCSWFKHLSVFEGGGFSMDMVALMDMQFSKLPLPKASFDRLKRCEPRTWIIPGDGAPFSQQGYYAWAEPVSREYQQAFREAYAPREKVGVFTLWQCKSGDAPETAHPGGSSRESPDTR